MPNDNDAAVQQQADAALKEISKQIPYVVGYKAPDQSPEDRHGEWQANSRKESTRNFSVENRTGVGSLDSVLVDATKDPYDFTDAEQIVAQQNKVEIVRQKTGTPPGMPIDPVRTVHVFRPIEDRLVKAIALTEAAMDLGDDPDNDASSTVGTALTLKLGDLKEALSTVRELMKVGGVETPALPERVQKLDALLAEA